MSFAEAVSIVPDQSKGRCLVANRSFCVGETVFTEKSFVYSSENPLPVHECFNFVFKAFKPKELDKIEAMAEFLANLSRVGSLDTARNVLELIAIYRLNQVGDEDVTSDEMKVKLALFGQLTAANLAECVDNMKAFRKKFPTVIPAAVTDAAAGGLLGILNTNQVELESINGSGLFVQMAISEHNCSPNCSYTTSSDLLTLTAVRPIAAGERVSIDYGNYYYECTPARIESLFHTYSFLCDCDSCASAPDTKRGFICSVCHAGGTSNGTWAMGQSVQSHGVIYPRGYQRTTCTAPAAPSTVFSSVLVPSPVVGSPSSLRYEYWQCNTCNRVCSEAEVNSFIAFEDEIRAYVVSAAATGVSTCMNDDEDDEDDDDEEEEGECVTSISILNDIVARKVMHCAHYLLYFSLEELAMAQVNMINNGYWRCGDPGVSEPDLQTKYATAFHSLEALSLLLEHTLPAVHHEKVIHYDKIAQLYVASCSINPSNVTLAKEYFRKAHQMSVLACGSDVPLSKDLLELATNTPTTVAQLQTHYQTRTCAGAEFNSFMSGSQGDASEMEF
jgi:hypothetical protein